MTTTKYVLRIAVAAIAFLIGQLAFTGVQNVFAGIRYVMTNLQPHKYTCSAMTVRRLSGDSGSEIAGKYYLLSESLTQGFPDFDHINIGTDELGTPMLFSSSVHTKQDHKFSSVSLNNNFLLFETEVINGVSYQFSGTIGMNTEDRVLRGYFKKLKNGRSIGSMYATFYPESGC